MRRPYVHGAATKEDPLRYEVTDEFLHDLEFGNWETGMGMIKAAVQEIRRLREEYDKLLKKYETATSRCQARSHRHDPS